MRYAVTLHVSLVVHLEDDAIGQLLLVGAQRTDEVTQALRQHRDGAVYQIHTGGTLRRLFVDDGAFLDVMAHVGNMYTHLPELAHLADTECIVEVLGVLRVDGTGPDVAHIQASADLLRCDARLDLLGSLLDILRVFVGQPVLRQDGVHLHIVVALLAQHVDDLTDDVLRVLRRPLGNLHDGLVARLTTLQLLLGYQDIMNEDITLRHEEGIVFLHLQFTDGLVHLMRDDLDHHSLLDMVLSTSHQRHFYTVAIQGEHRVALADEDGLAAIVGFKRVLAVSLTDKGTFLHLCLQVQPVGVVADLRQEVVPRHLLHQVDGHHLDGMRVELQSLEYLLKRERLVRILLKQRLQHFRNLFLAESFLAFAFAHSSKLLVIFCKDTKYTNKMITFAAKFS